jgi:hypothetical protein
MGMKFKRKLPGREINTSHVAASSDRHHPAVAHLIEEDIQSFLSLKCVKRTFPHI